MFARVLAGAIAGCEPLLIEVEVDIAGGLPAFTLVGLVCPYAYSKTVYSEK
ncbi:MAG: hypothetical protein HQM09_19290 [Candidatus Riflebacteria bacterium]|nr:hypothetical protein [Candidatus Riflebacteria bacterium]